MTIDCQEQEIPVYCYPVHDRVKPAPNGVTFTRRVISVHSKSGVSRQWTFTGSFNSSRSRIRLSNPLGSVICCGRKFVSLRLRNELWFYGPGNGLNSKIAGK